MLWRLFTFCGIVSAAYLVVWGDNSFYSVFCRVVFSLCVISIWFADTAEYLNKKYKKQ